MTTGAGSLDCSPLSCVGLNAHLGSIGHGVQRTLDTGEAGPPSSDCLVQTMVVMIAVEISVGLNPRPLWSCLGVDRLRQIGRTRLHNFAEPPRCVLPQQTTERSANRSSRCDGVRRYFHFPSGSRYSRHARIAASVQLIANFLLMPNFNRTLAPVEQLRWTLL